MKIPRLPFVVCVLLAGASAVDAQKPGQGGGTPGNGGTLAPPRPPPHCAPDAGWRWFPTPEPGPPTIGDPGRGGSGGGRGGSGGGGGDNPGGAGGPGGPVRPAPGDAPGRPGTGTGHSGPRGPSVTPGGKTDAGPAAPTTPAGFGADGTSAADGAKELDRPETEDSNAWQLWWNFNRDPLLSLDRWIEERDRESGEDSLARAAKIQKAFVELALPELRKVLIDGGTTPLVREALLTIARVSDGEIRTKVDFEHYTRFFLSSPHADVRMACILALGIQGDPLGIPLLTAVMRDDRDAREVAEGAVSERDRSLAAFALGMIGRESTWPEMRHDIATSMVATLEDSPWQVGVACVLALGQMPLEPCDGAKQTEEGEHVCRNSVLSMLSSLALAEGEHPWLRAHAACSAGRLANQVEGEIRGEVEDVLLFLADPRAKVEPEIRLGAVIGLGLLVRDGSDAVDGKALESLIAHAKQGEGMDCCFALISLAEVASRARLPAKASGDLRELLSADLGHGRKKLSGWAAMALAVLAHPRDGRDSESKDWAAGLLRQAVVGATSPSDAGAAALALGIVGDRSSATRECLLRQYERIEDPAFRVFGGLALGLLAIPEASPLLADTFTRDARAALPLRLLGNREVVASLVERAHGKNLADAVEAARALGQSLAPEAVGPLVDLVADPEVPAAVRVEAVAALGELADQDSMHWTSIYANDLQYRLLTPTLCSPSSQGLGMLDERVAATR